MNRHSYEPQPYRAEPRARMSPVVVALLVVAVVGLLAMAGAVVFFWALIAFGGPIG